MIGKNFRTAWALAALLLAPLPAAALFQDRVEVFAAENVTYDDNLFKLSKQIDPKPVIGSDERGDTVKQTSVGASLDVPYSLQRFQANYTWFTNRYDRFGYLDYDGWSGRAAWLWSLTPEATGDLGYTDGRALANFANLLGTTNRDLVRTRTAFADGTWFPVSTWRLHAGATAVRQTHSDETQSANDIDVATGVLGASYVTRRDDRLGLEGRFERGSSPHDDITVAGTPFQNGYHQSSVGAVAHWNATGLSVVDGRVDWVDRKYDQPTTADFNGATFRVADTWTPTGKLTIVSSAYHDIGPITDVQSANFVIVKGVAVKPRWAFSDKVSLDGDAEYNVWDYRGNLVTGQNYTHYVRTYGVTLSYRPLRKLLLQGGYTYEMRTSTAALADYRDNLFSLTARFGF